MMRWWSYKPLSVTAQYLDSVTYFYVLHISVPTTLISAIANTRVHTPTVIKWYVDAYFSINPGFKIHTGGVITLVGGSSQYISHKEKSEYPKTGSRRHCTKGY